jgi:outer membrane lipoprotein-sorting protein
MNAVKRVMLAMLAVVSAHLTAARASTNIVEKALADYDKVQTVSCEIRRTVESGAGRETFLSRVYFQRPDRLHVDNIAPLRRRIVADGTNFFSHVDGAPKGFSRPVSKLDAEHIISLRKVPGTAMDHLLRLKGLSPKHLESSPELPLRQAFQTDKTFAVVSGDNTGRIVRIELFPDASMKEKTAQVEYSDFVEVLTGVWIPTRHKTTAKFGNTTGTETVRIDNLSVNEPIAQTLFAPSAFFKDVRFVDTY